MSTYLVTAEDAEIQVEGGVVYFGRVRETAEHVFAEWNQMSTAHVELQECAGHGCDWQTIAEANTS